VVNNAYGVQSTKIAFKVNETSK